MIRASAISGIGGKSPACFLVETGTARFLLDMGEGARGQFPDLSQVGPVDAILISHGHADHIGGLHLADEVGDPPIYATAVTRAFAGHEKLGQARDLPLRGRIDIAGVSVETGRAGHAAGGVWMRIGGEDGVLYTGDICRESLLYPLDQPLPAATMIVDASYGEYDRDITPAIDAVSEAARQGPLLLPLPPTGRGVEIAVLLHEAGFPVSICDQHRQAAGVMLAAEADALVRDGRERLAGMLTQSARHGPDAAPQGVMIAANGGATGGVSKFLLERFMQMPNVRIMLTGHVEAGTNASLSLEQERASFIRWNVHPRLRDIAWLHEIVRPRSTVYAFCDDAAASALAARFT